MNWAIVADILLVSNWAEAEGSRDRGQKVALVPNSGLSPQISAACVLQSPATEGPLGLPCPMSACP